MRLLKLLAVTFLLLTACSEDPVDLAIPVCEKAISKYLTSPSSLEIVQSVSDIASDGAVVVLLTYDADNAFGAALRSEALCHMQPIRNRRDDLTLQWVGAADSYAFRFLEVMIDGVSLDFWQLEQLTYANCEGVFGAGSTEAGLCTIGLGGVFHGEQTGELEDQPSNFDPDALLEDLSGNQ